MTNTEYGPITLTEEGCIRGAQLHERYALIKYFLQEKLGVEADVAAEEAHGIEHAISLDTAKKLKVFLGR